MSASTSMSGRTWCRAVVFSAGALAAAVLFAGSAAEARGFVSFGFSAPAYYPPPAYYYPPPAYYPPPPVYYAPPVVYADPPPAYEAPRQTCREYQTSGIIDGRQEQLYGRACLQPDGSWKFQR